MPLIPENQNQSFAVYRGKSEPANDAVATPKSLYPSAARVFIAFKIYSFSDSVRFEMGPVIFV